MTALHSRCCTIHSKTRTCASTSCVLVLKRTHQPMITRPGSCSTARAITGSSRLPHCGHELRHAGTLRNSLQRGSKSRSRLFPVQALAGGSDPQDGCSDGTASDHKEAFYLPATTSTHCAFSAELLLATTRLGHLERYREEVRQLYEPGQPVDLTRAALLISNIFQPQLDHRLYFEALEHLVAAAALAVMRKVSAAAVGTRALDDSCSGFQGLDIRDARHVICAVHAINDLLYLEEKIGPNLADPYDPLNGSLADLLDTHKGNQWSLAILYLHILDGLGLPCAVVGSPERIFVRVGQPPILVQPQGCAGPKCSDRSTPPAFLVDMSQAAVVYALPPPVMAAESNMSASITAPESSGSMPNEGCTDAPDTHSNSRGSSSSTADTKANNLAQWNSALHTFLLQHHMHQQQHSGEASADQGIAPASDAALGGSSLSKSSSSNNSSDVNCDASLGESTADESSAWHELDAYAAQDAATRNSWKLLYGVGALSEFGGSVSSSWEPQDLSMSPIDTKGDGSASDLPANSSIGGMRASEWLGVLESPFAAAAHQPWPVDDSGAADAAPEHHVDQAGDAATDHYGAEGGETSSVSSMSTNHYGASHTDWVESVGAYSHGPWTSEVSNQGSEACSTDGSSHDSGRSLLGRVKALTWGDVAAVGGLQPVSKRLMLQQLLSGMKLSLMMSGRQEELMMVLRYLRATDPFSLSDLRDMALCLAERRPEEAAPLLREYLAVAPGAPDADMVAEVLAQVQLRVQLGRARGWQ